MCKILRQIWYKLLKRVFSPSLLLWHYNQSQQPNGMIISKCSHFNPMHEILLFHVNLRQHPHQSAHFHLTVGTVENLKYVFASVQQD